MSGGSFNCLYSHTLDDKAYEIEIMADLLDDLGEAGAAARTREAATALRLAESIRMEMSDVWHDIEWWQSGDYDRDDVREEVAKWRAKKEKP